MEEQGDACRRVLDHGTDLALAVFLDGGHVVEVVGVGVGPLDDLVGEGHVRVTEEHGLDESEAVALDGRDGANEVGRLFSVSH